MLIIFESKDSIRITDNDLDLSKKQQFTILSLMDGPKTASEISVKMDMPLTTVSSSLKELKEKEMIFPEKPIIKYETSSGVITKQADIEYWQLTKKGMLWSVNVSEANGFRKPRGYVEMLEDKFKIKAYNI